MRRLLVVMALITIIILSACVVAGAQGVRFITPQDGDTVRDVVRLQATKPSPDEGWISYKIETGGTGEFASAVVSPFAYAWDTRARDDDGKDLFRDGQYTLTAVAMSPSGRKVGEVSITVTLKNALSASEAPQRVPLALQYERNREMHYRAEGRWTIRPAADEEDPEDVYALAKEADGSVVAEWKNRVMSPTVAAGHAVLHVVVGRAGEQIGTQDPERLGRSGHCHTYMALRDGEMRLKHDDETDFAFAEMTITVPDRSLRVGDRWNGSILIQAIPYSDVAPSTVRAQHVVEGFEWVAGYPCLRIRSTFSVEDEKIKFSLQPRQQALGGEAGMFGGMPGEAMMEPGMMDPMMMGPPPEAGMMPGFGDEMGMMGMMGEGMGMGMGATGEIETSYVGERITWWAYELNRPVRIVDTITHTLEVERQAAGMGEMGMGGEMMGMPMEGMMLGPEMGPPEMIPPEPGMMLPGGMPPGAMPPGMEGMMMGPGEFGMGMGQMEPAEPLKVRINVSLVIEEVGL